MTMLPPLHVLRARVMGIGVLVLTYLFLLAPLIYVALASFDYGKRAYVVFPPEHFSFDAYLNIPSRYYNALWLSLRLAVVSSIVALVIGVSAALGLVRSDMRGKAIILAFLRAPLQIPGVVSGLAFLQAYYVVGAATGWYPTGTFIGLVIAHAFAAAPYVIGTMVAVSQRFDLNLEEAALVLGASRWGTFTQVTLPVLKPGLYVGGLYAFMTSFGEVPVTVFLSGPNYMTFPVEIFNSMQFDFEPTILAISTLVTALSLVMVLAVQRVVGLEVFVRIGGAD